MVDSSLFLVNLCHLIKTYFTGNSSRYFYKSKLITKSFKCGEPISVFIIFYTVL